MFSFQLYFERRERNPLRKKELEAQGVSRYRDYVEYEKERLPRKEKEKIRKMKKLGVEPERIESFRQSKVGEREAELKKQYYRQKIEKPNLLFNKFGIKVYADRYVTEDITPKSYRYRMIENIVTKLVRDFKDVLPNRKPKIVVTDMSENPVARDVSKTGYSYSPAGLYLDRLIYVDQNFVDDYDLLVHEYAHYIADRIPKQTEPMLKAEYKKMLDQYFEKVTRRKALEGRRNEKHRIAMAQRLGLPTDYAATNFDEWFAELITHWKSLPNTPETYRFKTALKQVLARL